VLLYSNLSLHYVTDNHWRDKLNQLLREARRTELNSKPESAWA